MTFFKLDVTSPWQQIMT